MNKRLFLFLFIPIFLAKIFVSCSENSTTDPQPKLADNFQKVLDHAITIQNLKGISAAVIIPNQNAWFGTSGISHEATPVSSEMLFHIGSAGKNFTAAIVLQLVEENVLSLEDSLHKWLPGFPNVDRTITVRQLLNHTSGLYNFTEDPVVWDIIFSDPLKYWTPEEVITSFLKEPYFSPGDDWHYSNANYHLLGMIIKQVTGSDMSTEFRNRFFNPFSLNHTFFAEEEMISGTMAHNWYDINQDGVLDDVSYIPMTSFYSFSWTSGAIITTTEDLAKWASYLYSGEFFSQSLLNEMLTFYPRSSPTVTGYGLGTERFEFYGKILWGHTGGGFGYNSVFMYLPQDGVSFVVLTNQVAPEIVSIASELLNEYLKF